MDHAQLIYGFWLAWKAVSSPITSSSSSEQCWGKELKLLFVRDDTATPRLEPFQWNISKALLPMQFAASCLEVPVCERATRQVSFLNSSNPSTLTTGRINPRNSAQQLVERSAFGKVYRISVIIKLCRAMKVLCLLGTASHPLCKRAQCASQERIQRFNVKELLRTFAAGSPARLFWNERDFRALSIDVHADAVLFVTKPSINISRCRDVRLREKSRLAAPLITLASCNGEQEEKGCCQIAESVPAVRSDTSELVSTPLLWTTRLTRKRAGKLVAVARLRKRRAKRLSLVRANKITKADKCAETRNLSDVTFGSICGSLNHHPHGNIHAMSKDFSVAKRLLGML